MTGSAGYQYTDATVTSGGVNAHGTGAQVPRAVGITATQTLYNGQQTANRGTQIFHDGAHGDHMPELAVL